MKQADLNRAVARATGESIRRIARLGFGLLIVPTRSLQRKPRCCGSGVRLPRAEAVAVPYPRQSA